MPEGLTSFIPTAFPASTRLLAALSIASVFAFPGLRAQDEETPPPKSGLVRITFLPPPMEGTLSLGLYKAGKLIRTLHAEAVADKDFTVGLNGLITHWDGKDDAGNPAPPGKYAARGYCVGSLEVEGIAYHGNDWMVDDNSPRIRQILALGFTPENELLVAASLADGSPAALRVTPEGKVAVEPASSAPAGTGPPAFELPGAGQRFTVREGQIVLAEGGATAQATDLQSPLDSARGTEGSLWVIDQTAAGPEVKQFSAKGEFLRRLVVPAGEPAPKCVAASTTKEYVALLEANETMQRVRLLALDTAAAKTGEGQPLSTWKTLFSKTILKGDEFAPIAGKLGRDKPFAAEEKVRVHLLPNPLFKDAIHELDVRVAVDVKGSSLVTADGLPLCRVTETPHLRWAVLGHDGPTKAITIFQSDGAVVEEFRVRKLANMMAFDAGEYEWPAR